MAAVETATVVTETSTVVDLGGRRARPADERRGIGCVTVTGFAPGVADRGIEVVLGIADRAPQFVEMRSLPRVVPWRLRRGAHHYWRGRR